MQANMASTVCKLVTVYCLGFIILRFGNIEAQLVINLIDDLGDTLDGTVSTVTSLLQNEVTRQIGGLRTNELCEHYGYKAEVHTVTTDDGYILTIFRCCSKTSPSNGEVVIILHGLVSSSDGFVMNMPGQGLTYVFADEGYDVWMINARGNYYSRDHIFKDPNDPASGFWDFSWDDIGYYDFTATIDYVREETGVPEVFLVGHSQGTSSTMALLSMRPEYNDHIKAVSLMAPIGFLNNSAPLYQLVGAIIEVGVILENQEFLPRRPFSDVLGTLCTGLIADLCNVGVNVLFGPSNNLNKTMIPVYLHHDPSGASFDQVLHFGREIKFGYFGERMQSSEVPPNFPLHEITAPAALHYSPTDTFTNPKDVDRLKSKLTGTKDSIVQTIDQIDWNHSDFIWSYLANDLVYSVILDWFKKHGAGSSLF